MKKFVTKSLLLLFALICFDKLLHYVLASYRPSDYKEFIDSKASFFESEDKFDLLIIGDSHSADALDTRIIDNSLKVNSFNLSIYHSSPYDQYWLVKSILDQKKLPKKIIIGTNPIMFSKPLGLSRYLPIILKDKLYSLILQGLPLNKNFILSSLQEKYLMSHIVKQLKGIEYVPTRNITNTYHGFLEFNNQMNLSHNNQKTTFEANQRKEQIEYLSKTIELLLKNDCQVYLLNPPIWDTQSNALRSQKKFTLFYQEIDKLSKEKGIDMYNFIEDNSPPSLTARDFLNPEHLNASGASKFTRAVCKQLLLK